MRWCWLLVLGACGDAALPQPSGDHHRYAIEREAVLNGDSAVTLDLAGAGRFDNRLGRAFSLLAMDRIRDLQDDVSDAVYHHRVADVVDVQVPAEDGEGRRGGFSISDGRDAGSEPTDDPLVTAWEDTLQGFVYRSDRPGTLTIRLGLFDDVVELRLLEARVSVSDPRAYPGRISATMAGGVPVDEVHVRLVPKLHDLMAAAVARDCQGGVPPSCGCVDSPDALAGGAYFIRYFDSPANPRFQDCEVSLEEVEDNVVVYNALYADLDIDGTMAMSFGVQLFAREVP